MINNFWGKCKGVLKVAVEKLKGSDKRFVVAQIVQEYGNGGQTAVAKEFHMGRDTVRKGLHEVTSGFKCEDSFKMRGRKKVIDKLPKLEEHLRGIIDSQSQTDPKFHSTRLYTRLTITQIRKQLIKQEGYTEIELPTNQTLNTMVNNLGYKLKKIQKTKPLKKIEQTDAIFENLKEVHEKTAEDDSVVRLSIDAKDRVKIGNFSRGGHSRVRKKACDHDFGDEFVTPFGIMNVKDGTVDISIALSKVTSDYIVDRIEEYWDDHDFTYNNSITTLLLNVDNGPECNSRRTQFIKRMVEFSIRHNIVVLLAYYPPYHSKYNPIERVWGALEQHWNGDLLDSTHSVIEFSKSMMYKGQHPTVTLIEKIYETGKGLEKNVMEIYETALDRMDGIGKWFLSISPSKCKEMINIELLE